MLSGKSHHVISCAWLFDLYLCADRLFTCGKQQFDGTGKFGLCMSLPGKGIFRLTYEAIGFTGFTLLDIQSPYKLPHLWFKFFSLSSTRTLPFSFQFLLKAFNLRKLFFNGAAMLAVKCEIFRPPSTCERHLKDVFVGQMVWLIVCVVTLLSCVTVILYLARPGVGGTCTSYIQFHRRGISNSEPCFPDSAGCCVHNADWFSLSGYTTEYVGDLVHEIGKTKTESMIANACNISGVIRTLFH